MLRAAERRGADLASWLATSCVRQFFRDSRPSWGRCRHPGPTGIRRPLHGPGDCQCRRQSRRRRC